MQVFLMFLICIHFWGSNVTQMHFKLHFKIDFVSSGLWWTKWSFAFTCHCIKSNLFWQIELLYYKWKGWSDINLRKGALCILRLFLPGRVIYFDALRINLIQNYCCVERFIIAELIHRLIEEITFLPSKGMNTFVMEHFRKRSIH